MNEIKKILEKHEKRISDLEKLLKSNLIQAISGEKVVLNLINSGFFNTQKKLGELKNELKTEAKFEKEVNYTKILEKLTNQNKLKRKMVGHQWMYRRYE